jgi:hypothetical protein
MKGKTELADAQNNWHDRRDPYKPEIERHWPEK